MTAILSWIGGKTAMAAAALLGLVFALGFAWQTAQIDGWPIFGGGLRAKVAALERELDAARLVQAQALQSAEAAARKTAEAADAEAGAHARALAASQSRTQTIIRKVPVYVSAKSDSACTLSWGAVRLLDAAIAGADPDSVAARLAPGEPDDGASDVRLSEIVALLAADFAAARENADQLTHLENAVRGQRAPN